VQAIIAEKAKPFAGGQIGLFARKVQCGYCGYTLRSVKNRGKHYLQCQTRHISRDACVGTFMPVAELEQTVLRELSCLSAQYLDKDSLMQNTKFSTNISINRDTVLKHIAAYEKRIDECGKGIRTLYLDKVKGILNDPDFWELSTNFTREREHLSQMLSAAQKELQELDERLKTSDNQQELIEQYINPEHLSREMVDILIDHIVIYRRNPVTKQLPIEIHWNF
jgi:hypothetical protein